MRLSGCLSIILFNIFISGFGQIYSTSAVFSENTEYASPDPVFFFSSIQGQMLSCDGPNSLETYTFEWTKYNSTNNTWSQSIQNQTGSSSQIIVTGIGGYQVRVTGSGVDNIYRCWAFEPLLNETQITVADETCFYLDLLAKSDSLPLVYYNPSSGTPIYINYGRIYNWTASTGTTLPQGALITMEAPVEDTKFEINVIDKFGNQSSANMNYTAIAVKAKYKWEEVKLEVPQEIHTLVEGSAPIEVRFEDESKGNITKWDWDFGNNTSHALERNPFYVFTTYGTYTVILRVINDLSGCESISEDNLEVVVTESILKAPNTFTPNGDGANDEFRVVYHSIKNYRITVFNRWGRKVYESTNPAEGWDGTVGNSLAPPGVYFYYIEAEGYLKNEKHKLSGPIHLIRGK